MALVNVEGVLGKEDTGPKNANKNPAYFIKSQMGGIDRITYCFERSARLDSLIGQLVTASATHNDAISPVGWVNEDVIQLKA